MDKRERLKAEIETLSDDRLNDLLSFIERWKKRPRPLNPGEKSILEKLLEIKIDGPPDFSENLDLYLNGDKKFEDDVR